jgi:hypothetical protein
VRRVENNERNMTCELKGKLDDRYINGKDMKDCKSLKTFNDLAH